MMVKSWREKGGYNNWINLEILGSKVKSVTSVVIVDIFVYIFLSHLNMS